MSGTELGGVWLKRPIDIAASAIALLVLSPLLLMAAVAAVLDSGFPIFYSHERVGREFQRFRVHKFRSMKRNNSGPQVTAAGDHRMTRLGRFLRATKLDELPQFWNVLMGEMSLVGPRPEVPEYVEMYRERYRRILTMRPGITDLASVLFRHEETVLAAASDPNEYYAQHLLPSKLDLAEEYVLKRSLMLDISILLRTVAAVFRAP